MSVVQLMQVQQQCSSAAAIQPWLCLTSKRGQTIRTSSGIKIIRGRSCTTSGLQPTKQGWSRKEQGPSSAAQHKQTPTAGESCMTMSSQL